MVHRFVGYVIVVAAVTSAACAARGPVPRPFPGASAPPASPPAAGEPAPVPAPQPAAGDVAAPPLAIEPASPLVATALLFRGTPYRNGGSDPAGFDCSGFVQYVFAQHGWRLPREVIEQFKAGDPIDRDAVRPGDLVFFETVAHGASHVGIALGGDRFVHAPSSRGVVRIESYQRDYWARRWVGARRLTAATPAN